jgi:hypothetical protein
MAQLPPRTGLGRAYEGQSYATWRAARDEIEENLRGTGFELPTHVTCPQGFTLELKTPRITAGTAWQGPYLTCSCPTVGRKWCYFQRAVRKKGAFGQHVWQGPPADGGAGRESREGAQPGQARAAGYAPYAVDGRGAAGNSGRKRTPTTGAAGAVGGRGLPPAAGMVGGRRHHQARVHTRPGERGGDVAVGTGRSRSNFQTAADLHYGSSSSSSSSSSSNIENVDGPRRKRTLGAAWKNTTKAEEEDLIASIRARLGAPARMLGTRTPRSEPRDLRGPPEVGHYTPQDLLDDPDYFDPSSPFWNGVVTAEALRPGQQADIPGAIGPKVPPSKPRRFQSEEEFWAARRLEGRGGGPGPGPASFLPGGGFVPQDASQIQQTVPSRLGRAEPQLDSSRSPSRALGVSQPATKRPRRGSLSPPGSVSGSAAALAPEESMMIESSQEVEEDSQEQLDRALTLSMQPSGGVDDDLKVALRRSMHI